MICIKNLNKCFKKEKVLTAIDLTLPNKGLLVIQGPSGCGKTTLLNCLSGLIDFEGQIKINEFNLNNKTQSELDDYRIRNIGFIFQDFRLFENETVKENVLFPLDSLAKINNEKKNIKCDEALKLVGLSDKKNDYVSLLSGGEKQRVCIARSLINDPKIILADEPTGALDEKNTYEIMKILTQIAKKSLVIMVTHDDYIANTYSDIKITMFDGKISEIKNFERQKETTNLPLIKNSSLKSRARIPFKFLFKHSFHTLKKKKFRSIICTSITSIGLIGVGLALSISSIIKENINNAYSSLIKKDQIVMSIKNDQKSIYGEYAASYIEVDELKKDHPNYIEDVGINYVADFENIFKDSNDLYLDSDGRKVKIDGISARNINEFEWIDCVNKDFYPYNKMNLENDEIVLGLPNKSILDLCYKLRIERSIDSLSNYLLGNDCYLIFSFEHLEWDYSDEQIVNLRGFCLDKDITIYHSNHLWNEYMFEERMRFPTSDDYTNQTKYPWTFKKCPYVYCKDNKEDFLTYANTDDVLNEYIFEISREKHFPLLNKNRDIKDNKRVLVFINTLKNINTSLVDSLLSNNENLMEPILGNNGGYVVYPYSLMIGFKENTYLSFDLKNINDAIDIEANISIENDQKIAYPDGLLQGHFSKTMLKGLSFNILPEEILYGRKAESLDEIVISRSIAKTIKEDCLNKTIYFAYPNNYLQNGDKTLKEYEILSLKVVGIVDTEENYIYHNYLWPLIFFQCKVGISMFNLKTNAVSFSLKNKKDLSQMITKLSKEYPQFDIVNPLEDINDSISELTTYVSTASLIFSIFASLTSIMLLSLCSYLYVFETRKEIGLSRCLGLSKSESNKLIYCHSITLTMISLILSIIELLVISLVFSLDGSSGLVFSVSPFSILCMFGLSMFISLASGFFISLVLRKTNAIEACKY